MSEETVVFKVGNCMAVRLVGECRLPKGMRVRERWEGDKIILEPIRDTWSDDFLSLAGAWPEGIERPNDTETPRDPFA